VNVVQWLSIYPGRRVTASGGIGGQCVDWANVYVMARGARPVRRDAAQWAWPGALAGWSWVENGPDNHPALGDVVVWRPNVPQLSIGPYGHVAVVVAADRMILLTMDQDWPVGSPVALTWHNYAGVAGWWAINA